MTNAHKYLCSSYSGESAFTQYLDEMKTEQKSTKSEQSS
ncbi:hypothetical protein J2R98_001192 [Alkalibacillus filiformis]|uniref:Uncharacterized protein n=1 Tax=Alkalibacillus filiformis TaxID=200990 RepID=A0ABU0DSF0_9BACI|nr:hypothetical protein [Alkalibacillus filiformis]